MKRKRYSEEQIVRIWERSGVASRWRRRAANTAYGQFSPQTSDTPNSAEPEKIGFPGF